MKIIHTKHNKVEDGFDMIAFSLVKTPVYSQAVIKEDTTPLEQSMQDFDEKAIKAIEEKIAEQESPKTDWKDLIQRFTYALKKVEDAKNSHIDEDHTDEALELVRATYPEDDVYMTKVIYDLATFAPKRYIIFNGIQLTVPYSNELAQDLFTFRGCDDTLELQKLILAGVANDLNDLGVQVNS
jgi:hypothetical protein